MENKFKINENGTVEKDEEITMVEDTVSSETTSEININGKWSAYSKQETHPFKYNVHLRYNRFNPDKNYLLGDINEPDAQDEMTYMHWIHNFLTECIIDKYEIITTSVDFESNINFKTELILYEDKQKEIQKIRKNLNVALSASCMIFTPSEFQTDYSELPVFKHFLFLDNIAKHCLYTNRDDSNCDFTYNSFKGNELFWLTQKFNELRKDHYKQITDGISDISSGASTFSGQKWYKVELLTKSPMFCNISMNNVLRG